MCVCVFSACLHTRAVRWVFADIVPDYLCGQNTAVLFLSLRFSVCVCALRQGRCMVLVCACEVIRTLQGCVHEHGRLKLQVQ